MGITLSYKNKKGPTFTFGVSLFYDFRQKLALEYDPFFGKLYTEMFENHLVFMMDKEAEQRFLKTLNTYLAGLNPPKKFCDFLFGADSDFQISPSTSKIIYNLIKAWPDNYIKEYGAQPFKIEPFKEFFKEAFEKKYTIIGN